VRFNGRVGVSRSSQRQNTANDSVSRVAAVLLEPNPPRYASVATTGSSAPPPPDAPLGRAGSHEQIRAAYADGGARLLLNAEMHSDLVSGIEYLREITDVMSQTQVPSRQDVTASPVVRHRVTQRARRQSVLSQT